jgi:hypothetical protein
MEIIARHYEALWVSYDGSYNLKKDNRGKQNLFIFPHNIKFGPSFKCKHSQVRVKYW